MLVKYIGHSKCILSDYNGKRYIFQKDQPKEVEKAVYDDMIQSGLFDARELIVCDKEKQKEPIPTAPAKEEKQEEVQKKPKKKRKTNKSKN